jgi:hypothetical protein
MSLVKKATETAVYKDLKTKLDNTFNKSKIHVTEDTIKFHVRDITHEEMSVLALVNRVYDVSLKRSGQGITVIILVY